MATIAKLTVVTTANTKQLDRSLKRTKKRVFGLRQDLRKLGMGLGLAFGGAAAFAFLRSAVMEFAAFQKQMAMVNTMLDEGATRLLPAYTKAIAKLAKTSGQSTQVLAKGLFDVLSASISTADAMDVLRVATRAAIGGGTDTATSVRVIVALLNSYGLAASEAEHVSDILFKTVQKGVITYEELANNISKVAPLARAAGMSMVQMAAIMAVLTKKGSTAEEAATRLNSILKTLPEAGKDFVNVMRQFAGVDLEGILQRVGNIRAAAGIAALAGDMKGLIETIKDVNDNVGAMEVGFAKMEDTLSTKFDRMSESWKGLKREIGDVSVAVFNLLSDSIGLYEKASDAIVAPFLETLKGNPEAAKLLGLATGAASPAGVAGGPAPATGPSAGALERLEKIAEENKRLDKQFKKFMTARNAVARQMIELMGGIEGREFLTLFDLQGLGLAKDQIEDIVRLTNQLATAEKRITEAKKQQQAAKQSARAIKDFAESVARSLETPIQQFKRFRDQIAEAVQAGALAAELAESALKARMGELMGGGGRGGFQAVNTARMSIAGLQRGAGGADPQVRKLEAIRVLIDEQVNLTRKQVDQGGLN